MYKLGRKNPKRARALLFKDIFKAIPSHPVAKDYLEQLSNWQMLGNDEVGDCVAVTWANDRRVDTALVGGKEYYPTLEQVLDVYKTQNPDFPTQDDGMDIQTLLEYLNKNSGPDGVKCIAFAKVDTENIEEVKAAMYIFGNVWLGTDVQNSNIDDFDKGRIWDYHKGESVAGGHAILSGGYHGFNKDDIRFITWAKETGMTDNFWSKLVNDGNGEAWVVIWPENLGTKQFVEGIDLEKLSQYYKDLTGRDLPVPEPVPQPPEPTPPPVPIPPVPTPVPIPPPPPGDRNFIETLLAWLKWVVSILEDILKDL